MHVFIDFWKLETENSILHVFSFLHKLNFENSFCFLPILSCQTNFSVLKIENYFWKQKIRRKNNYQIYSYFFIIHFYKKLNQTHLSPHMVDPMTITHNYILCRWKHKARNARITIKFIRAISWLVLFVWWPFKRLPITLLPCQFFSLLKQWPQKNKRDPLTAFFFLMIFFYKFSFFNFLL